MVNQIGELIATKIKTSKQLSEFTVLNNSLEGWHKDYKKLTKNPLDQVTKNFSSIVKNILKDKTELLGK